MKEEKRLGKVEERRKREEALARKQENEMRGTVMQTMTKTHKVRVEGGGNGWLGPVSPLVSYPTSLEDQDDEQEAASPDQEDRYQCADGPAGARVAVEEVRAGVVPGGRGRGGGRRGGRRPLT